MTEQGFKVMDSDIHVMEPHDLWLKYIEPKFKDRAPRFRETTGWQFEGHVFPAYMNTPERQRTAQIRHDKARARHVKIGRYTDPSEDLHGDDPQTPCRRSATRTSSSPPTGRTMTPPTPAPSTPSSACQE